MSWRTPLSKPLPCFGQPSHAGTAAILRNARFFSNVDSDGTSFLTVAMSVLTATDATAALVKMPVTQANHIAAEARPKSPKDEPARQQFKNLTQRDPVDK